MLCNPCISFVICYVFIIISCVSCNEPEPVCTSRYDFESKLLQKSIKLEFDMDILKEQYRKDIETLEASTTAAMDMIQTLSTDLSQEKTKQFENMEKFGSNLQQTIDERIQILENNHKLEKVEFADLYSNLQAKSEETMNIIKDQLNKYPVVFSSKELTDTSPAANTVLVFRNALTNIGDAYDPNSGYFTAPVNGTYSFSVQLCIQKAKYSHVQIYADQVLVNNAIFYDTDGGLPCRTLTTLVYLRQDARVCVKHGMAYSKGRIFGEEHSNRWNMFIGALVQ